MQIKQIQHDTLSHLILSRATTFSLASNGDLTLATECLESTQIYVSNSQEVGCFCDSLCYSPDTYPDWRFCCSGLPIRKILTGYCNSLNNNLLILIHFPLPDPRVYILWRSTWQFSAARYRKNWASPNATYLWTHQLWHHRYGTNGAKVHFWSKWVFSMYYHLRSFQFCTKSTTTIEILRSSPITNPKFHKILTNKPCFLASPKV
jgi:hypothetical protein